MKKVLKFIFKLSVSLSILLYLFFTLDLSKIIEAAEGINPSYWIPSFLLLFLSLLLMALKWEIILKKHIPAGLKKIFAIYWGSNLIKIFDLGAIGGEAYKMFSFEKKKTALMTCLLDKVLAIYWYLLLGASIFISFRLLENNSFPLIQILVFFVFLIFFSLSLLINSIRKPIIKKLPSLKIQNYLKKINFNSKDLILHATYSILLLINTTLIYSLIFFSLGISGLFVQTLILALILKAAVALPISIGGLGVREYFFIEFAAFVSIKAETALLASLIIYVLGIAYKLTGTIPFLFSRKN